MEHIASVTKFALKFNVFFHVNRSRKPFSKVINIGRTLVNKYSLITMTITQLINNSFLLNEDKIKSD